MFHVKHCVDNFRFSFRNWCSLSVFAKI